MSYKLLAIVGPTSSGKSELAVRLAKKFNGEIISCDSRQIYRGMDLGTGKIPGQWSVYKNLGRDFCKRFIYKKISHWCIDYISPGRQYSAAAFQRDARAAVADILERGKLPILCGGTMHWIDAVVYNQEIPDVKPDPRLRARLEKKSADDLYQRLKKLDPRRAADIDRFNKRRLIRALEIVISTGKPVPIRNPQSAIYNCLWIGIQPGQKILYEKIDKRLKQRLRQGMVDEVKRLHDGFRVGRRNIPRRSALSWKKLESFGLEYKYLALYLQKKLSYDDMLAQLSYAIKHYSKRQMTWWKRNKKIHWIKNISEAQKLVKKF